jgi:chromosomal replication initiation ATPase DnaA
VPDADAVGAVAMVPVADGLHPLGGLVDRVGIGRWTTWFKPLAVDQVEGLTIIIAPSRFHADRIRSDYEQMLRQLYGEVEVRP